MKLGTQVVMLCSSHLVIQEICVA